MKENYHIIKAENGYYVEVDCEGKSRKMVFEHEEDFRDFMAKTMMAELKRLGALNITMNYL